MKSIALSISLLILQLLCVRVAAQNLSLEVTQENVDFLPDTTIFCPVVRIDKTRLEYPQKVVLQIMDTVSGEQAYYFEAGPELIAGTKEDEAQGFRLIEQYFEIPLVDLPLGAYLFRLVVFLENGTVITVESNEEVL